MKKFVLCLGVCLLFAGCGGDKVTCTAEMEESGQKMTTEITAEFKNDKVSNVSAVMTFDNKDTAEAMCSLMKLGSDEDTKLDYECSGKSIKFKDFSQMSGDDSFKDLSKKEFKKQAEEAGYKCK